MVEKKKSVKYSKRCSNLIGESEGSPVNSHRLFGLKVQVDLNRLLWINVLSLHHVSEM